MAKLDSAILFTGKLGELVAYRMRGVEGIVVRKKGGVAKERIEKDPSFERTRQTTSEFSGRSAMSGWIMKGMRPLKLLADYNIAGPLNALLRPIQKMDTVSVLGRRHVQLSVNPKILEGFPLNNGTPFESIVRGNIVTSVDRDGLQASIEIPELIPAISFRPTTRHPMYGFVCVLSVVPDLFYHTDGYKPTHIERDAYGSVAVESAWYSVLEGSKPLELILALPKAPPDQYFSLMLTIGIRYGTMKDTETVQQVERAGAAKVIAMI